MKKLLLLIWTTTIIVVLLYSCSAHGQAFKKSTIIEMSAVATSLAADGYTTPWNVHNENNPVALPFISSITGRAFYFGGSFGAVLLTNRLLIHHPKTRHVINWSIAAIETGSAIHNVYANRITNAACARWKASGQTIPARCL